jgi:hypothetical protein
MQYVFYNTVHLNLLEDTQIKNLMMIKIMSARGANQKVIIY